MASVLWDFCRIAYHSVSDAELAAYDDVQGALEPVLWHLSTGSPFSISPTHVHKCALKPG